MIVKNTKNDKFRLLKPAGIFNILHGVTALMFILLNALNTLNVISLTNITKNNALYNIYMIFQLVVLILGIVAAVYAIRARQKEKQIMYYACFSIAGLNCTFLLFTGTITIFALFNLTAGIIMLRDLNNEEKRLSASYNFGGSAKALEQNKSTASIFDVTDKK